MAEWFTASLPEPIVRAPGTPTHPTAPAMPVDRTQTMGPRDSDVLSAEPDATPAPTAARPSDELGREPNAASDRYDLLAEHARGGLGRVVRAHDRHLGRTVAVKELLRTNELAEALFVREAMITARLQHPGIVPVHEAGRWPNGDPYYVMKLVSGRTLKECIAETQSLSDRLALLPHVLAVAEAVGYAHSNDVVHRDLKPANMIIGEFGETVVVDWGLARDLRAAETHPPLAPGSGSGDGRTVTGRVVGTPQYMSPEQARGDSVDARTDVYALGAILYEVLAGRAPVGGDSAQEILDRVLAGPPPPLCRTAPNVPSDLEAIVAKAMSRVADDRYPSARELAADLKRFQTGQLVTAQRYGRWRLLRRWGERNRGYVVLGAAALTAVTITSVVMLRRVLEERRLAEVRGEQAEHQRAAAEERKNQLVLAQVNAALPRDPTAAIAWLKNYPVDSASAPRVSGLLDEAEALGTAAHVWRTNDWLMGVALTRDGAFATFGGRDGKVRVADTATGAVRVLGQRPPLSAVEFTADGKGLITADAGHQIVLWDLATGHPEVLGIHETEVTDFTAAADGRMASIGMDGTIRIWDLAQRRLHRDLFADIPYRDRHGTAWDGQNGAIRVTADSEGQLFLRTDQAAPKLIARLPRPAMMLAMTSDARQLIAADGREIYLVDVAAGDYDIVAHHGQRPKQIAIDPTQRRAVVSGWVNDVILIDLATGEAELRRGHDDALYKAVFDHRGERLVTASDDSTTRVWDLDTGDTHVLRGHEDDVVAVAITPDGKTVASVSLDGSARLWHLDDRKAVVVGQLGLVRALQPLDDHRVRVVTISAPQRVIDVDLTTRKALVRHEVDDPAADPVISEDGHTIVLKQSLTATMWRDGEISTFEMPRTMRSGALAKNTARRVALLENNRLLRWDGDEESTLGTDVTARYVVLSPNGRWLALIGETDIEVRSADTGASLTRIERPRHRNEAKGKTWARFLSDNHRLLIADLAGVQVWTWADNSVVPLADSDNVSLELELSPDGSLLAGGGDARTVRVWDSHTGASRLILRGHRDLVRAMAFSPDGRQLVTGSYDRTVRLWNLSTGESRVLLGHVGPVWAVGWLGPDRLVSGGDDGTVRLWQVPTVPLPQPQQLRSRMRGATTAEISTDDRPTTPTMTL